MLSQIPNVLQNQNFPHLLGNTFQSNNSKNVINEVKSI